MTQSAWVAAEGQDSPNECPKYDTKPFDSEVSVMLEFWGIKSIPWLPSLPGPFWLGMVTPDRVLSMGKINRVQTWLMLDWIAWNRTVLSFNCV